MNTEDHRIEPIADSHTVQQSFAQERLWFIEQLHPGLTWYLMPCAIRLRGPVQLEALTMALSALEERHETLRTTFSSQDNINLQEVHPFAEKSLHTITVSKGDDATMWDALRLDQTTPFNLNTEPGWRVTLLKLSEEDHILSMVMYHIISDGWSVDVLRKELSVLYGAALQGKALCQKLEPLPVQYRDYSVWQRQQN